SRSPSRGAEPARPTDLTAPELAQLSNGLTLLNVQVVLAQAKCSGQRVDAGRFRLLKMALIERQCRGLLEFVEPQPTLDLVVGQQARATEGDAGTSSRVFSMIAAQMGDTRYRGRIVWMLLTSRPDLLPIDLKRQGRAEVTASASRPALRARRRAPITMLSMSEPHPALLPAGRDGGARDVPRDVNKVPLTEDAVLPVKVERYLSVSLE